MSRTPMMDEILELFTKFFDRLENVMSRRAFIASASLSLAIAEYSQLPWANAAKPDQTTKLSNLKQIIRRFLLGG